MMDSISVSGLILTACHGVLEQERRVGNQFRVDLTINLRDASRAMASDCIDDTVNYAEVIAIVKHEMASPSKLLENVAWRIRRSLCRRYADAIAGGSITISKLAPPIPAQLQAVAFTTTW